MNENYYKQEPIVKEMNNEFKSYYSKTIIRTLIYGAIGFLWVGVLSIPWYYLWTVSETNYGWFTLIIVLSTLIGTGIIYWLRKVWIRKNREHKSITFTVFIWFLYISISSMFFSYIIYLIVDNLLLCVIPFIVLSVITLVIALLDLLLYKKKKSYKFIINFSILILLVPTVIFIVIGILLLFYIGNTKMIPAILLTMAGYCLISIVMNIINFYQLNKIMTLMWYESIGLDEDLECRIASEFGLNVFAYILNTIIIVGTIILIVCSWFLGLFNKNNKEF